VLSLTVSGRGGSSASTGSAVLNIAAVDPTAAGFVTVYPCGEARPNASNLNFTAGLNIANTAVSRLGDSGRVCIYSSAPTELIVDITGYH
jgi:hypothetical protein